MPSSRSAGIWGMASKDFMMPSVSILMSGIWGTTASTVTDGGSIMPTDGAKETIDSTSLLSRSTGIWGMASIAATKGDISNSCASRLGMSTSTATIGDSRADNWAWMDSR